jgi:hypothetical protein
MRKQDRPKDRYGKPIETGCLYRLEQAGLPLKTVRVYYTEQDILMTEDIARGPGEANRFRSVSNIMPDVTWAQVDQDGVLVEPPVDRTVPSVEDQLGEIEQRALLIRAEIHRLWHLACQAVGVRPHDGSQLADECFKMVFNSQTSIEQVADLFHKQFSDCGGVR